MTWNHRYRRLEYGEKIISGDEVEASPDGWRGEPIWEPAGDTVGSEAPDPDYPSHRVYRRKRYEWHDALLLSAKLEAARRILAGPGTSEEKIAAIAEVVK